MTTLPIFPLTVDFSHEDKAAKGLRSLRAPAPVPSAPVYFTAREMVEMHPRLVLLGGRGAGKSVFAHALAQEKNAALIAVGHARDLAGITPGAGLLILDGIDRLGPEGQPDLAAALAAHPERPMVLLGDPAVIAGWTWPQGFAVHSLRGLSLDERTDAMKAQGLSPAVLSPFAQTPAFFAALAGLDQPVETLEALADSLVAQTPGRDEQALAALGAGGLANRAVDEILAARALATTPGLAAALFLAHPHVWGPVLDSLLRRRPEAFAEIAETILGGPDRAAMAGSLLLAAHGEAEQSRDAIAARLREIVEGGHLSVPERDAAARHLSQWGDPRDLDALCAIPGGRFTMGSGCHPNSEPIHDVELSPFRIGAFPVTNGQYTLFVAATGRVWRSPDNGVGERRNAPATDLTWHDARAYCAWLTGIWRHEGKISENEAVRLPTEPEWERAARGQTPAAGPAPVYPWGIEWRADACNCEETGLNRTCAVGLFPKGRSPYGCWDMAGQVWEWTSTLWGADMAAPHYGYPYRDDGREHGDAGPAIRRVLRGGCFSSTRLKAGAVYRGSLEPQGYWRGNGFRIVVASKAPPSSPIRT